MTIKLYQYIYDNTIYRRVELNNPVISVANFDTSRYMNISDKYNHVKSIIYCDWLKGIFDDKVIDDLSKCNKIYLALNKFYHIVSRTKIKTYDYPYDLRGNSLCDLPSSCKIEIVEGTTQYIFRISDLFKIINDCLTYHEYFHLAPREIKNPFTNKSFSISNLYNMYNRFKESAYTIPLLFQYFYLSNFEINKFIREYNYEITEWITSHTHQHMTKPVLIEKIKHMLKRTKRIFSNIFLSIDFPVSSLIDALYPFLKLYTSMLATRNSQKYYFCRREFIRKAYAFNKENKLFGRQIVKCHNNYLFNQDTYKYECKKSKSIVFQTEFVPFESLDKNKHVISSEQMKEFENILTHAASYDDDYDEVPDLIDSDDDYNSNDDDSDDMDIETFSDVPLESTIPLSGVENNNGDDDDEDDDDEDSVRIIIDRNGTQN